MYSTRGRKNINDQLFPALVMSIIFAVLFFFTWVMKIGKEDVSKFAVYFNNDSPKSFKIPEGGRLYEFTIRQSLTSSAIPEYSELEIEILDEDYAHVYSFYKDLWKERHSNGEGGVEVYKDVEMNFVIELHKKGTYHLRAFSNNQSLINVEVEKKRTGSMMFLWSAIFFGVIAIALFIFLDSFGERWNIDKSKKYLLEDLKKTSTKYYVIFGSLLYLIALIVSATHYGYAGYGDYLHAPTYFFEENMVIYLG